MTSNGILKVDRHIEQALPQLNSTAGLLAVLGLFTTLFAVPLTIYGETSLSVLNYWSELNYRHGYFILPISLWMITQSRNDLSLPRGSIWGLTLLIASLGLWVFARSIFVQILEHVALWMILVAFVSSVLGIRNTRIIAYPLVYLALAIPVGDGTVPILIDATTWVATQGLDLVGVAFYREGNLLFLSGGSFEVAEACSGFKFVMTGLTVGGLFAFEAYRGLKKRILFIVAIVFGCVVLNCIRAFLIMVIASASDMRYLADDHVWFGWSIFALGLLGFFALGAKFRDSVE